MTKIPHDIQELNPRYLTSGTTYVFNRRSAIPLLTSPELEQGPPEPISTHTQTSVGVRALNFHTVFRYVTYAQ
ncbi:hypothetical protein VTL71DRAFT_6681 [Oculimacula yallundae]|uniref:Uncharacterized protein n=1 Tax=Oculimacula yallundae TaxID=86028 RepID=A0ABR4BXN2_9HELO